MTVKRYDGNRNRQDGTTVIRVLDAQSVLRDVHIGQTADFTTEEILFLGKAHILSNPSDPSPTAPPSSSPLDLSEFLDQDGRIRSIYLPASTGGGGVSQVRLLDLGTVNIVDLLAGPVTLYTPAPGEAVLNFSRRDDFVPVTPVEGATIYLTQAPLDSSVINNERNLGFGLHPIWGNVSISQDSLKAVMQTVNTGFVVYEATGVWQSSHAYPDPNLITAAGRMWSSNIGTSDATVPDFASNIAGTVFDGTVTWTDEGPTPTAGSLHVYAVVLKFP